MKKKVWLLGVAVAALTSCTENEVLEIPESKLIGFETFVEKPTRADVTNDDNAAFKEFYVYAAKGTKVSNVYTQGGELVLGSEGGQMVTGGKGNWSYEPHAVWKQNHVYRFAAYANGNGTGQDPFNAKLATGVTFVPGERTADAKWGLNISSYTVSDKDLVVAAPNEISIADLNAAPPQVSLDFKHVLAKVIFQFYYSGAKGSTLEIEPFSLLASKTGNLEARFQSEDKIAGTIALNAEWKNITVVPGNYESLSENEKQKYRYDFFPKNEGVNQQWTTGSIQSAVYMLPQSNQDLVIPAITIYTKDTNGDITNTKTFTNVSLHMSSYADWRPGFAYRYVADISPTAHQIHFTTKVTTFNDDNNRNQTITNGVVTP